MQTYCFFTKQKLPAVLFKALFTLKQHRPIPAAKKSFAYKNFIYNQNPLSLKGFAERLRQFILNTLPQSRKALIKFFIWNCHKSLPELSHKRFHHRLFSHRTASLSSLLHFPSNNYNVLKPYSTLIASTSAASIPCFLLGSKKPPGDIVWNQTDRFSTLLVQKLFAVLIQNIPVAVWKHFATHCRASQ